MSGSIISSKKTVDAPLSSVLAVLHDATRLAKLNPLVVSITQHNDDPSVYTITDKLSVLGIPLPGKVVYTAKFLFLDEGADVDVTATGVKNQSQWRTKQDGDKVEVTETVTVQANAIIKQFVMCTIRRSHKELLDALAREVEGTNAANSRMNLRRYIMIGSTIIVIAAVAVTRVSSRFFDTKLFWVSTGIIILLFLGLVMPASDPYGSFHVALNVRPGDDPDSPPSTEWLNMGYWKNVFVFPEACEALALKILERAGCMPGGHVLDVGHAHGDSLLMHLRHPKVPHPATLIGITSISSQHARALARAEECLSSTSAPACEVKLFCGDAVFHPRAEDHPLNPTSLTQSFTSIIAIDCAYHFASRETFLRQSFVRLSPGGTIALGDLAISKPLPFVFRTLISKLLAVHSENMVTPTMYTDQLKMIGYTNIRIEDISENVFPGFTSFLKSRGGIWRLMSLVIDWWVAAGGMFLIVSATKPEIRSDSQL